MDDSASDDSLSDQLFFAVQEAARLKAEREELAAQQRLTSLRRRSRKRSSRGRNKKPNGGGSILPFEKALKIF